MTRRTALDGAPVAPSGASVSLPVPDVLLDLVAERVAALVLDRLAGPATPSSPWLDVAEAAAYLRCGKRHVYDLARDEQVPVHRDGTRLLFHRAELDAYLFGTAATPLPPAVNTRCAQGSRGDHGRGSPLLSDPREAA